MAIRAKHIMSGKISVGANTAVKEVAHRMITYGLPGMPVVNESMEVIGVVTEFNVLGAVREGMDLGKITASRIMTPNPATAEVNTSTDDLIQTMLLNNYTMLPILNNGKYAGVVSRFSIMDALVSPDYSVFSAKELKESLIGA
jgi:CBS domain-containing protein